MALVLQNSKDSEVKVNKDFAPMDTDSAHPPSDRLALLYHLAQTFNSSLDLNEVLNRVMDEVIVATKAERGFVMLREPDGRLSFKVAREIDQQTIDDAAFQVSRSVIEKVAQDGKPVITYDAQTDTRFSMRQSVVILGLRSVMCAPLQLKDNILGVIYVDNRMQAGIFTQSDLELVSAIASNAAIAIENARLYQLAVEKGRLERELQMARQVQVSLLPTQVPKIPGWEFAARWLPARQVAGDFYDFLFLDPERVGMVIADVSDKGMPASLFMALTRTIIRASMDQDAQPAASLERANRLICADSANGMFVTLFFAQIAHQTGHLTYVNAGHNPPIFYQPRPSTDGTDQTCFLSRTGMAVGIFADNLYEQRTIQLSKGDFVLLYTDGVTDAQNPAGDYFGVERLQSLLSAHQDASAEDLLQAIESTLADFTAGQDPFDDITLLIIRRV